MCFGTFYYINKNNQGNPNNNNEVHRQDCEWLAKINYNNLEGLGSFFNSKDAVNEAKNRGYNKADGCIHCCPESHKE